MTMKMKLLDYTLICMIAGMAQLASSQAAFAQTTEAAQNTLPAPPAQIDCTGNDCTSADGLLLRVRTRGEQQPQTRGTNDGDTSPVLQPDRRVTIETEQPGKVQAVGKWSAQLPDGGVIWATEDPNLGQPQFNVSAPSLVAFDGGRITKPVRFYAYSNYPAFIERAEVLVYRASDTDLVTPLATVDLPVAAVSEVIWDGTLPAGFEARAGDELLYLVRAYGADGSFDETFPRRLQLVTPDEVERGNQALRQSVERRNGIALSVEEAEQRSLIDGVFGENSLRQQNIAIYGSRIRILLGQDQ
jgi:hypothetical protein